MSGQNDRHLRGTSDCQVEQNLTPGSGVSVATTTADGVYMHAYANRVTSSGSTDWVNEGDHFQLYLS